MSLWTVADTTTAFWLDGSDASTLFDATTGGSTPSAGGSVARWEDKSGSDFHVRQSGTTARPTRQTAAQNGLDVVRFDGSNDTMRCGASTLFRNVSYGAIYCVRKINASPSGNPWLIAVSNPSPTFLRAMLDLNRGGTGKYGSGGRRLDANTFQTVQSSANFGTANFEIQCAEFIYSSATLRNVINGTIDGTTTSFQTAGNTSSTDSSQFDLATNLFNSWLACDIGEIIISYTQADREKLEGCLAWKWGIQGSLPANHPYKNAAPTKASPMQIFAAAHNAVRGAL